MKKIFTVFIACALILMADIAHAQLLIEQGKIRLKVEPGQTVTGFINVHNTSNKNALKLKAYWEDFEYIAPFSGKKKFLPQGTSEFSCSQWVSFSPQTFALAPLEKREISYTIKVPSDAQGGHYGVLFFESGAGSADSDIGVKIIARVGSLFLIESTNSSKQIKTGGWELTDQSTIGASFTNQGNVFLIPQTTYYVLNKEGIAVARGKLDKFYLPPGESTPFEIKLDASLPPGSYTAIVTFDLNDGDSLVREIDFLKNNNKIKLLKVRR